MWINELKGYAQGLFRFFVCIFFFLDALLDISVRVIYNVK